MSEEIIKSITKSERNFAQIFVDHNLLPHMNLNEHSLIKNIFFPKKVINLYISYTLGQQLKYLTLANFTIGNSLFGSVKLTKNAYPDKTSILATAQDLIPIQNFHLQMEAMEKMLPFLELIWAHLCMLV